MLANKTGNRSDWPRGTHSPHSNEGEASASLVANRSCYQFCLGALTSDQPVNLTTWLPSQAPDNLQPGAIPPATGYRNTTAPTTTTSHHYRHQLQYHYCHHLRRHFPAATAQPHSPVTKSVIYLVSVTLGIIVDSDSNVFQRTK